MSHRKRKTQKRGGAYTSSDLYKAIQANDYTKTEEILKANPSFANRGFSEGSIPFFMYFYESQPLSQIINWYKLFEQHGAKLDIKKDNYSIIDFFMIPILVVFKETRSPQKERNQKLYDQVKTPAFHEVMDYLLSIGVTPNEQTKRKLDDFIYNLETRGAPNTGDPSSVASLSNSDRQSLESLRLLQRKFSGDSQDNEPGAVNGGGRRKSKTRRSRNTRKLKN